MLISPAYAQGAPGGGGFDIVALLPLILIFVVFYFLLIRPQQKRMKEHKQMVQAVRRGDKVVTGGGLVGTITKVFDDSNEVQVELAEGVKVRAIRDTLQQVLSKTQPADKEKKQQAANDGGGQAPGGLAGIGKLLGFGGDKK